jgi:hypothetical protein
MDDDVRSSIERTAFVYEHSPSPVTLRGRDASSEADDPYDSQPHISKLMFSPQPRADYAPGLRELIERTMGAECLALKKWPGQNDKRPLLYALEYTAKGIVFDITRPEKLNAAFAQIAGERQWRPCDCCQKGNGPFLGCVVATNFANGACANCACSWHARKCNFHVKCKSQHIFHELPVNAVQQRENAGCLWWNCLRLHLGLHLRSKSHRLSLEIPQHHQLHNRPPLCLMPPTSLYHRGKHLLI